MFTLLLCSIHFLLELVDFKIAAKAKQNMPERGIIGKRGC
jgi:hypothetical protein